MDGARIRARALAARLGTIDPANADLFASRAAAFAAATGLRAAEWRRQAAAAPGVVFFHRDGNYLAAFLGVQPRPDAFVFLPEGRHVHNQVAQDFQVRQRLDDDPLGRQAVELHAASQVQRSFNIARAAQSVFSLSSTAGTFLANLQLTTSGGTDTGTVSFTVSATGTANCSIINSESLTSTSAGNCQVVATKLGTTNYLTATDTRTVTFGRASLTYTTSVSANLKYGSTTTATYRSNRSLGVGAVPNLTGTLVFESSTTHFHFIIKY
jgi:hypothetical protein